ncbi:ABC-type methionine transport system permease subunit [Staphylococcus caledonicus]|uniref:VraH family peptide resistance protein n=1 Tax=Staphylococcus ureilyticus TaxID=94138 RepID=UPI0021D0D27F|nr:VraH family protein [Staphylococcus ureilyticus]MDW3936965.1 VraH family protein [Staphylococcus saprophyticus]MDW4138762.1 VraH family protein [Staphylococcus saprophyticus]MDW4286945.1 VraH family protein [Staphylococcus saprophyticus]UXS59851.1 VraH family protein [Staphylococcus ureilyticus]
MSLKEMWNYLLNKKWESNDIWIVILYMLIASCFVTPLLGVPIGVIAYLILNEGVLKK